MIYFSYFKDNNNNQYTLALHTNYHNKDKESMVYVKDMGVSISSQMESDELYKSYKCSHFQFSFYTDNPIEIVKDFGFLNTYVVLYKEDKKTKRNILQFQGYVTNNSFNGDFAHSKNFLTLQAQDPLSTLKYRKYKRVNSTSGLVTIKDIVLSMLSDLGVYNDVYITNSLCVPNGNTVNVFEQIEVQEDNFFNEDNEPYTCMEVLDEIMKMLNLSIVPVGDQVYILSYDSVRNGYDSYLHFFFNSTEAVNIVNGIGAVIIDYPDRMGTWFRNGEVSLNHTLRLHGKHFASNDTQISILPPINKFVVKNDVYPYESLLPYLDKLSLYNQTKVYDNVGKITTYMSNVIDSKFTSYIIESGDGKRYEPKTTVISNDGNKENIIIFDVNEILNNERKITPHRFHLRVLGNYNSPISSNIKTFCYTRMDDGKVYQNNAPLENLELTHTLIKDNMVCVPVQTQTVNIEKDENYVIKLGEIEWLFSVYGQYNASLKSTPIPMMEVRLSKIPVSSDNYIVLNGKWEAYDNYLCLPISDHNRVEKVVSSRMGIPAEIKLGDNLYWNSETETWVGEKTICKLPLQYNKDSKAYGVSYPFKNNITYNSFLGDKRGLALPLTNPHYNLSEIDFQDLTITILRPETHHNLDEYNSVKSWKLSDFNVEIVTKDSEQRYIPIKQEHNLEYENNVEGETYEEKTINLKFNTNIKNGYNKSDLYYWEDNKHKRLKHLLNRSNGELLQIEHHIINNHLNQYNHPNIHLLTTLNNTEEVKPYTLFHYQPYINDYMVVNKIQRDYYRDTQTIELIEKHNNAHKI